MKRILCLFFTALTLISLAIPAFAETTAFDDLPALDMDNTSIEYDFEHVFLGDYSVGDFYPNPSKTDVELITMAEKGYKKSENLFDINSITKMISTTGINRSNYYSLNNNILTNNFGEYSSKTYFVCNVSFLEKGTYTLSAYCSNAYSIGIRTNSGYVFKKISSSNGYYSFTFTLDEDSEILGISLSGAGNSSNYTMVNAQFSEIMLVKGENALSYYIPYNISYDYGLYFYLYNPSRLNIVKDSENNLVQFGSNVTGGIKTDPLYKKHQLKLVDTWGATEETETHTNALVLKFSLLNYDDFIFLEEFTSRFYDVSGIELVTNENSNATEYGVAQIFEFYKVNGFPTCSIDKTEVLRIDNLAFSFYRVKSEVPNVYKDLHSVSFSIPNSIINKYGEINALHAVWKECLTQPVLIADNKEIVDEFNSVLNQEVTSDFEYSLGFEFIDDNISNHSVFGCYNYFFNPNFNSDASFTDYYTGLNKYGLATYLEEPFYNNLLNKLYFAFYSKDLFNPNSVCVTSEQMMAKLDEYKWSDEVFSSIDKTNFDLVNPTLYDVTMMDELGVYRVPTFWEKITQGGLRNILIENKKYDNIETINASDKELNEDNFAEAYLVFKDDVEKIQDLMSTDSTTYILHYTVTNYITHEAYIYDNEFNKVKCNAIVGQATAIRNFDFIDMYFKKGDVVTCLPIGGDPQNFAPDLTGHEKPLPEDRCGEFLEFLEKLLGIAIILVVITIALKLFTMFKKTKVKVVVKNEKNKR